MGLWEKGSLTETAMETGKLALKFRHGVLCLPGSLLMRHSNIHTTNNNEIYYRLARLPVCSTICLLTYSSFFVFYIVLSSPTSLTCHRHWHVDLAWPLMHLITSNIMIGHSSHSCFWYTVTSRAWSYINVKTWEKSARLSGHFSKMVQI